MTPGGTSGSHTARLTTPFGADPPSLRGFDARLNLQAAALTRGTLRVDRVGLSASLTAGLLDLERFAGTLHGGALQLAEHIVATLFLHDSAGGMSFVGCTTSL